MASSIETGLCRPQQQQHALASFYPLSHLSHFEASGHLSFYSKVQVFSHYKQGSKQHDVIPTDNKAGRSKWNLELFYSEYSLRDGTFLPRVQRCCKCATESANVSQEVTGSGNTKTLTLF